MSFSSTVSPMPGFGKQRPKLILTNGQSYRSITLSPVLIACTVVMLTGLILWSVGLSGFIYFRDDVVRSLVRKHAITVERYEDRITSLRLQVDSIRTKQFINQDSFAGVIDDLRDRQTMLESHQSEIMGIVERAKQAGIRIRTDAPETGAPLKTGGLSPAVNDQASHTVTLASREYAGDAPVSRPAIPPRDALVFADTPDTSMTRIARQIDEELRAYATGQSAVLNDVERQAYSRAEKLSGLLGRIKLDRKRFGLNRPANIGGPFIPAKDAGALTEVARQIARIDKSLAVINQYETTIAGLPIRRPLAKGHSMSSRFGTRIDPFLRRRAFHSGLDFRAPRGTKVTSTAAGRVIKAGRSGGYGRMVEIDHGNGLTTRYAHLSRIKVNKGQRVKAGQLVGLVGSTGRSTGPHLHYETRVDGNAVNPIRFLTAL